MKNGLNILLVEDDPDTRSNLTDILELDGHRVRQAGSFSEVRDAGRQPDVHLAMVDRRLPEGEIENLLGELSELLPNAEVIVVTGFAEVRATIDAFKLGVTDYLLKPVHPDVIRRSVTRIAKQKQVENELRREQRFISQVLETSEAFVVVLDLKGCVLRLNPHFSAVTGWQLCDLVGKNYIDHCIPSAERERIQRIFELTASGERSSGVQNGVLTTDGRIRQIRWCDTTLKDDNDEIESILAIGIDITDVVEAQESAARDHRLAAIGQTVTGIAHESRNALHRINASIELLQLDIPPESESREEVDSIRRAAKELHHTLEEVRQYAAPIQLQCEVVRLHEIWRRVWNDLRGTRGDRDAKLIESYCKCGCPVDVDVLRLERLFRNLFENSLAACNDPVRVRVECRCDGRDTILLDIEDNGPGLTAEQHNKLFEPFYTTKTRGTGLGMPIVQRIVDAHNGKIQVVEPRNGGARFLIQLSKHHSATADDCSGKINAAQ